MDGITLVMTKSRETMIKSSISMRNSFRYCFDTLCSRINCNDSEPRGESRAAIAIFFSTYCVIPSLLSDNSICGSDTFNLLRNSNELKKTKLVTVGVQWKMARD